METNDYDSEILYAGLASDISRWEMGPSERSRMRSCCKEMLATLNDCRGRTLQERWEDFEARLWPRWVSGDGRPQTVRWRWGTWALVMTRRVRPGWALMSSGHVMRWVHHLPACDPIRSETEVLAGVVAQLEWVSAPVRPFGVSLGARVLFVGGHEQLAQITEADLANVPPIRGLDVLDAALCRLGNFERTPRRSISRRRRIGRLTAAEMVERSDIPERFRALTVLYLEHYAERISDTYETLHQKQTVLGHLWRFVDERYPEVSCSSELTPAQVRAFVPYAIERARTVRRVRGEDGDTTTAHNWLSHVRVFFADICTWGTEPASPFASYVPTVVPLTRHDLVGVGFEKARRRGAARMAATVIDLEREMPNIRAYALGRWHETEQALVADPGNQKHVVAERDAFWDWAVLELLIQSGLRLEEALELTTLDILKRRLTDGRLYYMLHVKPSKFDRARVIPIGDGLGRVLAEIIRHVKAFYGTDHVPACDHWDHHERRLNPRAPYLLQAVRHPSPMSPDNVRQRLARLSKGAGARRADGSTLLLLPHDCRRMFASEHLNNNTPVHVIQALLGHATLDTVMIYAKLYPAELVEGYRRSLRGLYSTVHGPESLRNPTVQEWASFSASCSMRDMGTHLCALPTGEHCSKGLVCLGCVHAQPKKSAVPVFRRMLASHRSALFGARERGEPAGQIAARELEVARIEAALRRAEELASDVAQAIEAETAVTHIGTEVAG